MKYRKLRIAWSVVWGVAAVLLIVLWVRSYWIADGVFGPVTSKYGLALSSVPGSLGVHVYSNEPSPIRPQWKIASQPYDEWYAGAEKVQFTSSRLWGAFYRGQYGYMAPDWFALIVLATIAAAPWLPWWSNRFSLRTLLIATTLVAVGLGVIVWTLGR
jgi:hypothetical protein